MTDVILTDTDLQGVVTLAGGDLADLRRRVQADTAEGFEIYYLGIRNQEMPKHMRKATKRLYRKREKHRRVAFKAFRGATKTTTFTEAFTSYQIGCHPERSNAFIQASDISARKHASNVAEIISKNPGFRLMFPHVVPDDGGGEGQGKGWGAQGYWVRVTEKVMPYDEWVRVRHKDPTLIGDSYKAAAIVGLHPIGVFCIDDINDDKNTESKPLRKEVNRILKETIFPMMEDTAWGIFSQTPWRKDDAMALIEATDVWEVMNIPVLVPDKNGVQITVRAADGSIMYSVKAKLTWPEKFDVATIIKLYKQVGTVGFARMYLNDLAMAEGSLLKLEWLHDYPAADISKTWPVVIGVDYASVMDKLSEEDRDYFALSVGRILPGGGGVLVDGFVDHVSQGQALMLVRSWAMQYPTTILVVVEAMGKGEEFYYALLNNSSLPLLKAKTGHFNLMRHVKDQLAPMFEFARLWVSDAKTDYLKAFEQQWIEQPHTDHDDLLAATYYMAVGMVQMGGLAPPGEMVGGIAEDSWFEDADKEAKADALVDPWVSLGRARG